MTDVSTSIDATTSLSESPSDICKLVLVSKTDDVIVVSIPGTDYRLHLRPSVPASSIAAQEGKRIRGRVRGRALRIHGAAAGGRFIEPIYGHPRIVQGTVAVVDDRLNRLLVDMVIPVWLDLAEGQRATEFSVGQTVNMYVESGMIFVPA
ncbi:MAG: hypothetical protein SGJ11_12625 [Phycisphaerae bacterium]|nr:hypothetical protein [Phycisphaerae bacterium]